MRPRDLLLLTGLGLLGSVATARADATSSRLDALEAEARALGTDLPGATPPTPAAKQQQLLDAIVAYRMGDYDRAVVGLFELAGGTTLAGPELDQANFYLAEALYQKGDRGAARGYYAKITSNASKYYQPAQLRLVEIAIHQKDDAAEALSALDRSGMQTAQVPYVKGKFAFSQNKFDDAINYFSQVQKGSDYELLAAYYTGVAAVGKKDLSRAVQIFEDLATRKPRTANDRRVVELTALALGRLYYEQDQFSKSIDNYLRVDRLSDLFPDALFEVAWVYVKNKQFDKALTALELLALSDPNSKKTPTVKILEGNLRIRKAQMLRQEEIEGVVHNADTPNTPHPTIDGEYDKASSLFADIHTLYFPAWQALSSVVTAKADPTPYVLQIADRPQKGFQATAPLPELAAQWLREEPAVERFVSVEADLGEIQARLDSSAQTVRRLQVVLASPDKGAMFPDLAHRRTRLFEMQDELIKLRADLADQALRLTDGNAELAQLSATRKSTIQQYANTGDPEKAFADRVRATRNDFDKQEASAAEIEDAIAKVDAMAVALRKYATDAKPEQLAAELRTSIATQLDQVAQDRAQLDAELGEIRRELQEGRDLSGVADDQILGARNLRKQVIASLDGEHRVLAGFASASRDPGKSKALAQQGDQAARIGQALDQVLAQIDGLVDRQIAQAKTQLAQETDTIAKLRVELADADADAKAAGATAVADSFKAVADKLYDIVIRADVGTVDVAWSQKLDTDDDLKRYNLNRSRDLKQLKDEFKDILDGGVAKPSAPRSAEMPKAAPVADPPKSPDAGKGGDRVKPADTSKKPADPTVKPDQQQQQKADPKKDPKKTGGAR